MFYNAHAYVASKIYKSSDKLLIVGSILPDLAITKIISWEDGLHGKENARDFNKYIDNEYPSLSKLCDGIMAHCVLDDFTHKSYRGDIGYAYQNNKEIIKKVMNVYGIEEKYAKVKGHNYIESGVDWFVLKKYPEVQLQVKTSIESVDVDLLSKAIGSYFKIKEDEFGNALREYFHLVTKNDLRKMEGWLKLWGGLEKAMSLRKAREAQKRDLLKISMKVVEGSHLEFLEFSIKEGSKKLV